MNSSFIFPLEKDGRGLKPLLDEWVKKVNVPDFIPNDPISIPHLFSKKQDIEITGLFAATLAWGQRPTIIKNCLRLIEFFENAPHDFILHHKEKDLKRFSGFVHRTFNETDLLYFIFFLREYYNKNESLETAFSKGIKQGDTNMKNGIIHFKKIFFSYEHLKRTEKHISSPEKNSACKRLNMYLRWMVRKDKNGVDFGIWEKISPSLLLCPLDLHVARVARHLGILKREQDDWKSVIELTDFLKQLDANDPAKYDFALYGIGINGNFDF